MVTGYEVSMYNHIEQIARHLNRIANCMEAAEARARTVGQPTEPHSGGEPVD